MVIYRKRSICNNHQAYLTQILPWYANWRKPYMVLNMLQEPGMKSYTTLWSNLVSFQEKCDLSIFIYNHQNLSLYALVYVDYMLLTSSSSTLFHNLITKFHEKFSLKKFGIPQYFPSI